jgi:hypothetical protein
MECLQVDLLKEPADLPKCWIWKSATLWLGVASEIWCEIFEDQVLLVPPSESLLVVVLQCLTTFISDDEES